MLRKLALVYVFISFLSYGYGLVRAIELGAFYSVMPWFSWSINLVGIFSVYSYSANRKFLSNNAWAFLFFAFVSLRIYELVPRGLLVSNVPLHVNMAIALKYAWYVVPSILCLGYLSLRRSGEEDL